MSLPIDPIRWIWIEADEDSPVQFLSDKQLEDRLTHPEEYGIRRFLVAPPNDEADPNFWPKGQVIVVPFQPLLPEPVTQVFRYRVPETT